MLLLLKVTQFILQSLYELFEASKWYRNDSDFIKKIFICVPKMNGFETS